MGLQTPNTGLYIPGNGLQLVKELALHHGDLIDDQVATTYPVLADSGPHRQFNTLLQGSLPRANTCNTKTIVQGTPMKEVGSVVRGSSLKCTWLAIGGTCSRSLQQEESDVSVLHNYTEKGKRYFYFLFFFLIRFNVLLFLWAWHVA